METKSHYRVHKGTPLVSILRQINTHHILKPCFIKMHFNIILRLCLDPRSGIFLSGFPA
jgi:hypothetical protein